MMQRLTAFRTLVGAIIFTLWSAGALFAYFVGLSTMPDDLPGAVRMFLGLMGWLISTPPYVPIFLALVLWFWVLPRAGESAPARPKSGGLMTPHEVIKYLGDEAKWGMQTRNFIRVVEEGGHRIEYRKDERLEAFEEFQREAKDPDTRIRAYGRLNGRGAPEAISHTFWLTNWFSVLETLRDGHRTSPAVPSAHGEVFYTDVVVERRGVVETWPRMSMFERWLDARKEATREKELRRLLANLPPEPPDYVTLHEAGVWLYDAASEPVRERIRNMISQSHPTIAEYAGALVAEAGWAGVCDIFVRREPDLPIERVDPPNAGFNVFDSVFPTTQRKVELFVLRSDLGSILRHYEPDK